jgi:hypothetical protein
MAYSNGYLPATALTNVQGSIQLENKTAQQYFAMKAAAAQVGVTINIATPAGGYRSWATQLDMRANPAKYNITPGIIPGLPSEHGFGTCVDIASGLAWVKANGSRWGFTFPLSFDPNHAQYDVTTTAGSGGTPIEGYDDMISPEQMNTINQMIQRATRYRLYKNSGTNAIMALNIFSGDIMDCTHGQAEINGWMALQLVGHGENAVTVTQAEWDALRDRAAKIKS